jgi:hypothetical protein
VTVLAAIVAAVAATWFQARLVGDATQQPLAASAVAVTPRV